MTEQGENMDNNKSLEIYYIRHADAENGSADGRDVCDRDITPAGAEQLRFLAERFKGAKIDAILSSPLVRTVKTAAAVAKAVEGDIPVEIVPQLIEKGATPGYTGLSVEELKQYCDNLILCGDKICELPAQGDSTETKEECLKRAATVAEYIKNRFDYGQRIVIVSHGVFGINFFQAAMGIEKEYDFRFTNFNTGVTKLKFSPDGVRRISFHNDVSHLIPIFPDYQFRM